MPAALVYDSVYRLQKHLKVLRTLSELKDNLAKLALRLEGVTGTTMSLTRTTTRLALMYRL